MEKLIAPAAAATARPEITHHALRRTAMGLVEEAEAESLLGKLTPIQRQRLAKKLLEGEAALEDQGAA